MIFIFITMGVPYAITIMMGLVPCKPTGPSFSTPGFSPGSLPVLLPIPDPTQSHSITIVQPDLLIVSMRTSFRISLHLTLPLPDRPF